MGETGFAEEAMNQIHANNVTSEHGSTVFSNLPLQLNKACFNRFLVSDSGKKLMMFSKKQKFPVEFTLMCAMGACDSQAKQVKNCIF